MIPLWTTTSDAVAVGVGWAFSSEGRPWVAQRVWPMPSDARRAALAQHRLRAILMPAGARRTSSRACAEDRDARRVVAAILEPLQALDDDADRALVPDVADDSDTWRLASCLLVRFLAASAPAQPRPDRPAAPRPTRQGVRAARPS